MDDNAGSEPWIYVWPVGVYFCPRLTVSQHCAEHTVGKRLTFACKNDTK